MPDNLRWKVAIYLFTVTIIMVPNISLWLISELFHRHLNAAEVADETCGGGVLWRQR